MLSMCFVPHGRAKQQLQRQALPQTIATSPAPLWSEMLTVKPSDSVSGLSSPLTHFSPVQVKQVPVIPLAAFCCVALQ